MKHAYAIALSSLPFVFCAQGCSGSSDAATCPLDPACYVVSASGECSLNLGAVCEGSTWRCSSVGKLGTGCAADGGIVPAAPDAGGCVLDTLNPPLACTSNATCSPYGGTCEFDGLNGPGECVCGGVQHDAGPGPDACTGPECIGCGLPAIVVTCGGPSDMSTCGPYGAECVGAGPYYCECLSDEGPYGVDERTR